VYRRWPCKTKEKQIFSTLPILEAGPKFVPVAPSILECLVECLCAGLSFDDGHTKLYKRIYQIDVDSIFRLAKYIFRSTSFILYSCVAQQSTAVAKQEKRKKKLFENSVAYSFTAFP
jgi:hypothetical protein